MRARRATVEALGRLVKVTPALRSAVADVVSELMVAAVTRGAAGDRDRTLEVRLDRFDDALRVTVRDDATPPAALLEAVRHAPEAHRCRCGADPEGAWAELQLV